MNIVRSAAELKSAPRKVCAAIGVFDGVHLGHQQVIHQTIADARQIEAKAVVVTFDCHPNTVVAPERTPPMIYSLSKRLSVIESLGADAVLLVHFDLELSRKSAEEFIRGLARDFGQIGSVCVGSRFTFGHKRSGNVTLLRTLGQELRFAVHGMAAVALDGEPVSSTRIREAIRAGNLDDAGQMLGRAYSLAGEVVRGDRMGRKLGFPTANLSVAGLALPPTGVYAVHAACRGASHRGALNIGYRPTLSQPEPRLQVEVHLLDFEGDLYGEDLELTFVQKLRDEQKFPSTDALRAQIARDIAAARALFE